MPGVSYRQTSYSDRSSSRRRAISLAIALAANLLLVVMLLTLAPAVERPPVSMANPVLLQLLPVPPVPPLNMMMLSQEDFAASDISKLPAHAEQQASATGAGEAGGGAKGNGEGPGGAMLYDADWYRRPTHAELAYYLPAGVDGWGEIACQTVARYHVDNCRQLGDSQSGSGLARAIQNAAWQFLVMPPRIDGKPILGAWVRIRIEITPDGVRE